MNTYFKRFACLFLVVPLFALFMIPSAGAAGVMEKSSVYDLLASANSFMDLSTYTYSASPILSASRSTGLNNNIGLRVSTNAPLAFDRLYVTLYYETVPLYVYCNGVRGDISNASDSWSMWVFDVSGSDPTSTFDLKATMPSNFSGFADLGVGAFYGWYKTEMVVDYAQFELTCTGSSTHLPTAFGKELPCTLDMWTTYDSYLPGSFMVNMELESPVSYSDYMEISLTVPFVMAEGDGSLDRDFLSSFLEASFFVSEIGLEGDYRPLEVIYEDIGTCVVSEIDTFGSFLYTFRVDTSGYDLGNYVVGCKFYLRAFDMAEFSYSGEMIKEYFSQLYVWPAYFGIPQSYPNFIAGFVGRFEQFAFNMDVWFEETYSMVYDRLTYIYKALTGKDPGASAEAGSIQDGFDQLENFEDSLEAGFNEVSNDMVTGVGAGITSFGPALAFVGHWLTNIADSIGPFHIVLTWPIFIGICMFIYHRVPGVTRVGRSGKNDGGGEDAG